MACPPGRGHGRGVGTGRGVGRPPSAPSEHVDQGRIERLEAQMAALVGMFQYFVQQQTATPAPPVHPPTVPVAAPPIAPFVAPTVAEPEGLAEPAVNPVLPPAGPIPDVTAASCAVPGVPVAPVGTAVMAPASYRSVFPVTDPVANDKADRAEQARAEQARAKAVLPEFKNSEPQIFKGKKRAPSVSGGGSSRQNKKAKQTLPCVFCGGTHRARFCKRRHGRCFKCGQQGHTATKCSQGLGHEIRRQLSSHLTTDFDNCVEAEIQIPRAERDATERGKDKKLISSGSASASHQQCGLRPCVFCGRPHYANTCPRRHGRCFGCKQPGHIQENCPQRTTPDHSTVPAPVLPYQRQGTSSNAASSGRPPLPR